MEYFALLYNLLKKSSNYIIQSENVTKAHIYIFSWKPTCFQGDCNLRNFTKNFFPIVRMSHARN